jgi:hypothetical protein
MANTEDTSNQGTQKVIFDPTVLYRKVIKKSQFNKSTGDISHAVFMRREPGEDGKPKDTKGLSVNYNCKLEDLPGRIPNPLAILETTAQKVRSIKSLDVVPDHSIDHANITGLPENGPEKSPAEKDGAERLATALMQASTRVWP